MDDQSFRHEWKHVISQADHQILRTRLRALMKIDPHAAGKGGYRIRSLYFDNADDKILREKLDGVNCRDKFRIRYYNNDLSRISLEKKSKIDGLCRKISAPITLSECEAILQGDWRWLQYAEHPLLRELFQQMEWNLLRPKAVVDYWREPFIYPAGNVRITLDSDIRTGLSDIRFLSDTLPTIPIPGHTGQCVLEIKYDTFLPDFLRLAVQTGGRQASAFSKYAAARVL